MTSHTHCTHDYTKAARAACRKLCAAEAAVWAAKRTALWEACEASEARIGGARRMLMTAARRFGPTTNFSDALTTLVENNIDWRIVCQINS